MSALHLEQVSHRYPGATSHTLDAVDLAVEPGEMLSVVGPSGSGKSTLLRVAAGLAEPDSGRILVGGHDVTARPAEQRGITAMFQHPHLFTHLSVLDNVAFGPRLRGASRREARETARRYLALVHLEHLGARRSRQLSGGQQQRVALARALATEEQVLLLDEPFSALDAGLRRSMHDLLEEVRAALAPTVVMVTHDLDEAALADRVAVIDHGRLPQVGTVSSLYRRPASVMVARLLGGFNEIDGLVRDQSREATHTSPWGEAPLPGSCAARGRATLLVRREQLLLEPGARADGADDLTGAGALVRVVGVTRAGPRQVASVERLGGATGASAGRLEVELPLGTEVGPGQVHRVRLDPRHGVWAVSAGTTHDGVPAGAPA